MSTGCSVGKDSVLSVVASAFGASDVFPRPCPQPGPRPLRGPRGRAPRERKGIRFPSVVSDTSAGVFICEDELFFSLEVDSGSFVAGAAEAKKPGGGSLIFKRDGGSTVSFDPEEPEAFGMSVEEEVLGSDVEVSFDCEGVVPAVDDKIGGNLRFDDRRGRCFMCSVVVCGGGGDTALVSACEFATGSVR